MEIIYEPKGAGKTTKLIKMSVEQNAYIIVANEKRAHDLKKQAVNLGYPQMLFPVTVNEYMQTKMRGSHVKNVLLDDADQILQMLFHTVNINAITLTKKE